MVKILLCLSLILAAGCSSSHDYIYGTANGSVSIVEWKDGKLKEIQKLETGVSGAICYSPKHGTLYVVSGRATKDGSPNGRILTLDENGKVALKGKFNFPHGYTYIALDYTGDYLIAASYGTGHTDVFKLDAEGMPHLKDTVYENKNTAHAVLISPDNKYVYIPYVKQHNSLHQYSFDAQTGKMKALDPPKAEVHPTAGPRHLVRHPSKPFVYSSNEQAVGVSVWSSNENGTLTFKQICPANDTIAGPGLSASSIVITPDGKYVFSAQRGKDPKKNFIHSYEVLSDGKVKPIGKTPCDHIPWIMQLTSDGSHLLVSASTGGTLTAFEIQTNGSLAEKAKNKWGAGFRHMIVIDR